MVVDMNTFKGATLPNFTSINTTRLSIEDTVEDTIYYPDTLFVAALEEKTKHGKNLIIVKNTFF